MIDFPFQSMEMGFKAKAVNMETKGQRTILRRYMGARGSFHCPESLTA